MENQLHPQPAQATGSDAGGPIEFWRILRRRKGLLILFAFSGALMGHLFTVPQKPIYQAHTSIEIAGLNDNFLNTKQVKPVTETGSTLEIADLQTQIRILLSESLLGRVLDKLNMAGGDALKNAQQGVKVHATGQSRILEIGVDSPNPVMAANSRASVDLPPPAFPNIVTRFMRPNARLRTRTASGASL